ncbi:MAG TPA: LuxR C-terminal-related transcriptional regulator, partial [Thermomicrobiales bacterium]|nr:LuxR C-terminal-related transcriptional regulator [Thermomicrobiales bacterium]
IARVLITKGDHDAREQALSALSRQIQTAEITGRLGIRITALALRAMGHWNRGDRVSALISLEQAMRLAEPEGYIRSFADLGLPMARLLQEARHRRVMPAYVDRLLAAFNSVDLATTPSNASLPEPLSAREHEVLRSLAAGLTNREIAAALFISPETVKKHTSSIYGKLGVRGRAEAIARSLELGLLD